ncbi:MAG: choice-of-anchor J domain-containing protein [Flavobacteriales bacterium]|nr:choice-of-anchor J domain-containing protein [Flavobacteriales bacterium]
MLTIAELKALYSGTPVSFTQAKSVYAVVTADENDGNFYKNISVQDHTGGITLRLLNSGGLYMGDSIRIYLPGTKLSEYAGMMQIDSVDVDNNVIKQATLVHVEPLVRTIAQLTPAALDTIQSMLIQLNDVEFTVADATGSTWADAANQDYGEHLLEDCSLSGTVMVRTSGYSNYAAQPLPTGKGSIQCIAGRYVSGPSTTIQLSNRSMATVNMNGPRCPGQELPFFFKNFEDQSISSGGWTQQNVSGNVPWYADVYQSYHFGRITNFIGGSNQACETWYISPSIDLSSTTNPQLSFRTACNYAGAELQVLVSTDYVSGLPSTATWTPLSATMSSGTWTWTLSGNIDLTSYISTNTHFAYKYTGTSSDGKNYELDDIRIVDL